MQLRRALWEALAGIAAVLASFLTMYAIGAGVSAGPSAAIVAAVLALTLWRRASSTHASPWLTLAMLASIAVAAALVGRLLATHPVLGAAVFVVAIAASIWLRQYGRRAAEIGSLIALPFVVMLIAPVRPDALGGPWVDLALVVCAGAAAFGWTTVVRLVSTRLGLMRAEVPSPLSRDAPASRSGLNVSVRMALQMAVALTAAFAIGFWAFPMHWGWVVLTAFIVCSGARGRGDAAYKGLLRLVGALAGTIGAAVLAQVALPNGVAAAAAIFAALFLGMWLRERSYAYWAACVTLALALLQHLEGEQAMALLLGRIEGIFVGAVCAVAATWFVYPIHTESVVRRRVADVLAALDELFRDPDAPGHERAKNLAVVEHRAAEMDRAAPPVELHRRVFARGADEHPAAWIEIVRELVTHARERVDCNSRDGHDSTLKAIRHCRRSLGRRLTPQELAAAGDAPVSASLRRVRESLTNGF